MSRSIYDIDPAGNVLCTYSGTDAEKETLRSVSDTIIRPSLFLSRLPLCLGLGPLTAPMPTV